MVFCYSAITQADHPPVRIFSFAVLNPGNFCARSNPISTISSPWFFNLLEKRAWIASMDVPMKYGPIIDPDFTAIAAMVSEFNFTPHTVMVCMFTAI